MYLCGRKTIQELIMSEKKVPLFDCPKDFLIGDASGTILNEYARYPCKILCGVYALMVRGSASATINISEYTLHKDDFIFFEPGSFLFVHDCSNDALVYYIIFSGEFMAKHILQNSVGGFRYKNVSIHLSEAYTDVLKDIFALLVKACESGMLHSENMPFILNFFQANYNEYLQHHITDNSQTTDRGETIYKEFCQLVLNHYTEWHFVSQYAQQMMLSLPHLCATIKRISGKTANSIITEILLNDAKSRLKLTSQSTKEIAMALGFPDALAFTRFFKQYVQKSPKQYRVND